MIRLTKLKLFLQNTSFRKHIFFLIFFTGFALLLLLAVRSFSLLSGFIDTLYLNKREEIITRQIHTEIDSLNDKIEKIKLLLHKLNMKKLPEHAKYSVEDVIHEAIRSHGVSLEEMKTSFTRQKGSDETKRLRLSCSATFPVLWEFLRAIEPVQDMQISSIRIDSERSATENLNVIIAIDFINR